MAGVVGERQYPIRLKPDLYDEVKRLADERGRSVNWVMARLLAKAVQPDQRDWLVEALRQDPV